LTVDTLGKVKKMSGQEQEIKSGEKAPANVQTPASVKTEIAQEFRSLASAMQQATAKSANATKASGWTKWFHTSTS
jgi:hypothetical protein